MAWQKVIEHPNPNWEYEDTPTHPGVGHRNESSYASQLNGKIDNSGKTKYYSLRKIRT